MNGALHTKKISGGEPQEDASESECQLCRLHIRRSSSSSSDSHESSEASIEDKASKTLDLLESAWREKHPTGPTLKQWVMATAFLDGLQGHHWDTSDAPSPDVLGSSPQIPNADASDNGTELKGDSRIFELTLGLLRAMEPLSPTALRECERTLVLMDICEELLMADAETSAEEPKIQEAPSSPLEIQSCKEPDVKASESDPEVQPCGVTPLARAVSPPQKPSSASKSSSLVQKLKTKVAKIQKQ
ncbi:hypothetical protein C8J56DRAFT_1163375, partial [Mycena floridula]